MQLRSNSQGVVDPMSTTLSILDTKGAEVGTMELAEGWLERVKGEQAVHDSVVAFLAGQRAGTASTKTRGHVRGTSAKPYRQKGTGRARAGTRKSPVWRGGGIVFGPHPRSFAKGINRKVQLLALRRALAERIDAGEVILVDDFSVDSPKTRLVVEQLGSIGAGLDTLILVDEVTPDLELAVRNLPGVEVMKTGSVNTYWFLLFKKVVITKAGLETLGSRIGVEEK